MANELPSICFLSQAFPDDEKAYRGIFIKNLAKHLGDNGFQVVVITPRIFKWSKKREHEGNVEIFRFAFPSGGKLLISYKKIPVFRMILYMGACAIRTCMVINSHSCQLIHVHWIHPNGVVGLLVKVLFRRPLIIHVRGSDFNLFATRNRFFRALTKIILAHADRILCTSDSLKSGIIRTFPKLNERKILVIYNDIDTTQFHPVPEHQARATLRIAQKRLHFLFVGNLVREKGIPDLVDVVKRLPGDLKDKMMLHIIGTGPLEKNLRLEAHERTIHFHGSVTQDQIPLWLNASNLLILPSEREGMPNVVLEALTCGTPVLATRVGDIPKFIRDGENGFLMDRRNKKEKLIEFLRHMLESPEELIAMKKRMHRNAELRVPQKKHIPVEQVYASLLKGWVHA